MRHLIVVCLAFMMGLNVACSRVEDLGKDDLHSEPTIEIVSGDTLDIVGFTLAHELATSEGRLPYNVGDEFGYTGSYTYKSYVVRTEYTYQDDGNSIWVWEDTLSSIIGFYPYLRSEVYDLADVQFHIRSCAQGDRSLSGKGQICMIRLSSISFVPRMERIWMYGFLVNHRN